MSGTFMVIHPCYEIDHSYVLRINPSAFCIVFQVFLRLLTVVTICGNLSVIVSVIYFRQLHTPTNWLILSLSVADMLVGILVFPLMMEFSSDICRYNKDLFCDLRIMFNVLLCTASILNLCFIAVDRYCAICHPMKYRSKITPNIVLTMASVTWGLSILIGVFFFVIRTGEEKCAESCFLEFVIASTMGFLFSFYLPVIIMVCIYLKIFLVAQKQARSIQNTLSKANFTKMERKATKILAVVMGFFLLCWLPFFLCTTVTSLSGTFVPPVFFEALNWLALLNSTFNPFIYAFFYSWFRSAFRMIISGKIFQGDYTNSKLY